MSPERYWSPLRGAGTTPLLFSFLVQFPTFDSTTHTPIRPNFFYSCCFYLLLSLQLLLSAQHTGVPQHNLGPTTHFSHLGIMESRTRLAFKKFVVLRMASPWHGGLHRQLFLLTSICASSFSSCLVLFQGVTLSLYQLSFCLLFFFH